MHQSSNQLLWHSSYFRKTSQQLAFENSFSNIFGNSFTSYCWSDGGEHLLWIQKLPEQFLIVSTIVSIPLAIFSVWSLVARWDDSLSYYLESKSDNELLAKQFRRLSSDPNIDQQSFQQQFSVLDAQNESRKRQDDKYPLTEKGKSSRHANCIEKLQLSMCSLQNNPNLTSQHSMSRSAGQF